MLINEITEKTGLTKKAVRFYESKGLLTVTRSENGYRTYTEESLSRLNQIKLLRLAGISISDIKLLFSGVVGMDELIAKREAEINKEGGNIADGLARLRSLATRCESRDFDTITELDEEEVPQMSVGEVIVGIDIGTTTISAAVIDLKVRRSVEVYTIPYDARLTTEDSLFAECRAELIIEKALALCAHIVKSYENIRAIGVTGQMHGIVYLGKSGEILSPLFTWQDKRADKEAEGGLSYAEEMNSVLCERVASGYGFATHYYNLKNSLVPSGAYTVATIMDLFVMRLVDRSLPLMHTSNAASLGLFDTKELRFSCEAMKNLGITDITPPEVVKGFSSAGEYMGVPVSVAIGDNQASFIGSVREPEKTLLVNIGTGGQICSATSEFVSNETLETRPLYDGKYILCGSSLSGGAAYSLLEKFFRRTILASGAPCESAYEIMNSMAEEAYRNEYPTPKVNTCFAGQRHNPTLRGAILGIDSACFTPEAVTLGFIKGMCEELHGFFDANLCGKELVVASGNAAQKIPVMKEVLSDIFSLPVLISDGREEASLGAALFAARAFKIITADDVCEFIKYKE